MWRDRVRGKLMIRDWCECRQCVAIVECCFWITNCRPYITTSSGIVGQFYTGPTVEHIYPTCINFVTVVIIRSILVQ